jgi:hypothetical protein
VEGILELLSGHRENRTGGLAAAGPAQRGARIVTAVLVALALASVWGIAAGSLSLGLAAANVYKLPMVVLLSALSALPPALIAWFLLEIKDSPLDLVEAHARGLLWAGLMLGAFAPLLALYAHTSATVAPLLLQGSAALALIVGAAAAIRALYRGGSSKGRRLVALTVALAVQLAALLQLIALASPILPVPTRFSRGIDGIAAQRHATPAE